MGRSTVGEAEGYLEATRSRYPARAIGDFLGGEAEGHLEATWRRKNVRAIGRLAAGEARSHSPRDSLADWSPHALGYLTVAEAEGHFEVTWSPPIAFSTDEHFGELEVHYFEDYPQARKITYTNR